MVLPGFSPRYVSGYPDGLIEKPKISLEVPPIPLRDFSARVCQELPRGFHLIFSHAFFQQFLQKLLRIFRQWLLRQLTQGLFQELIQGFPLNSSTETSKNFSENSFRNFFKNSFRYSSKNSFKQFSMYFFWNCSILLEYPPEICLKFILRFSKKSIQVYF